MLKNADFYGKRYTRHQKRQMLREHAMGLFNDNKEETKPLKKKDGRKKQHKRKK